MGHRLRLGPQYQPLPGHTPLPPLAKRLSLRVRDNTVVVSCDNPATVTPRDNAVSFSLVDFGFWGGRACTR